MDSLYIGGIMVVLLVVTIISGVYVGVGLACLGFIGMWWISGSMDVAARLLGTTSFSAIMDYVFSVLPFFVLMGLFAAISGAGRDLFTAANVITRGTRGGLGIATVLANAVFAAITGVSVASAAIFSKIALPEMLRYGYKKNFALGGCGRQLSPGDAHSSKRPLCDLWRPFRGGHRPAAHRRGSSWVGHDGNLFCRHQTHDLEESGLGKAPNRIG